jgi:hypothetical protein
MESRIKLLKDATKSQVSDNRHYGITTSDNLADEAKALYHDGYTFNTDYLLSALQAMKHLNEGSLEGVVMYLPKEPYPIILDNGIQCYMIAPMLRKEDA